MRRGILLLPAAFAGLAAPAAAEQYWGRTRINSVAAVTDDRQYPQYSNIVFIGVADKSWLPEKCRKMPGLLMRDDKYALFSLAQAAMTSRRKVVLKADDEAMIGDYCSVFQLTAYSK